MRKRTTAFLCIVSLLVGLLSGCGLFEKEVKVTPNVKPQSTQNSSQDSLTPLQTPSNTPKPSQVNEEYPLEDDFVVEIEGENETVTMQLYDLSFTDYGHLEAGIYIDSSMYDVSFIDGGYMVVPTGSGEVSTFMEIRYNKDVSDDDLAAGVFELYTSQLDVVDQGYYETDYCYARVVTGAAADGTFWVAYIVPVEAGGCAYMVLCLPPEAIEGHGARLEASTATFFEK